MQREVGQEGKQRLPGASARWGRRGVRWNRCTGAAPSSKAGCWLPAPEVNVLSCNPIVIPLARRDALFTLRHGFSRRPARHVVQAAREMEGGKRGEEEESLAEIVQSVYTHPASSIKLGSKLTQCPMWQLIYFNTPSKQETSGKKMEKKKHLSL